MSNEIKAALITGVLGLIASILAAIIGVSFGKNQGKEETINQVNSQVANINGNNNTVTMNSVDDLIQEYNKLASENDSLTSQNMKYFDDLTVANEELKRLENQSSKEVKDLKTQLDKMPVIEFKNLALVINAEDISINKNNSMVIIDGKEYFSKEITQKLISNNQNMTINDDTLFIGKVIADKSSLFKNHINECYETYTFSTEKDSFGNNRSNGLFFNWKDYYQNPYIRYNLV